VQLLQKFAAKGYVDTIDQIDLEQLYAEGKRGIVTDLDNTLVGQKVPDATETCKVFLARARAIGFDIVVVSNNNYARVEKFAAPLGLKFIHRARKPRKAVFVKALRMLGLRANQTLMLGDQSMTDIFGGNRAGLHTILVRPIAPEQEGVPTHINRFMERIVIRLLTRSGYAHPWRRSPGKEH
jgi:HAD superfamily phosphatase (TIGR01668 family)